MRVSAHAPNYSEGWDRRVVGAQEFEIAVAIIVPLHSSLGNRARLHFKNKNNNLLSSFGLQLVT